MLRRAVMEEVRSKYKIEQLKTNPTVRAYRDFFWKLGVDPTKTRPSSEALVRRVLHGMRIPHISTVVDSYNLASLKTLIPLSGFDLDLVSPPLYIRFSRENEEFLGIGMDVPAKLTGQMLVLADKNHVMCIYPHRDADATKITNRTKNVLVVGYGAAGINGSWLVKAVKTALSYIQTTSNGNIEEVEVYKQ